MCVPCLILMHQVRSSGMMGIDTTAQAPRGRAMWKQFVSVYLLVEKPFPKNISASYNNINSL